MTVFSCSSFDRLSSNRRPIEHRCGEDSASCRCCCCSYYSDEEDRSAVTTLPVDRHWRWSYAGQCLTHMVYVLRRPPASHPDRSTAVRCVHKRTTTIESACLISGEEPARFGQRSRLIWAVRISGHAQSRTALGSTTTGVLLGSFSSRCPKPSISPMRPVGLGTGHSCAFLVKASRSSSVTETI